MKPRPELILSREEVEQLRGRLVAGQLQQPDYGVVLKLLDTLQVLMDALENNKGSIRRLLKMLFGAGSEKTATVTGEGKPQDGQKPRGSTSAGKGHGRTAAKGYWGAKRVEVPHAQLTVGEQCPDCARGKLYQLKAFSPLLWLEGRAPVAATLYECQSMRCSACGTVFAASPPGEAAEKKYHESVGSMIALFRYGNGMPFYRLQQLQRSMGIPLPASVQWQLVRQKAQALQPLYQALMHFAAQGTLFHVDDTSVKILELLKGGASNHPPKDSPPQTQEKSSSSAHTTAIVAEADGHQIALYQSGRKIAGQNMDQLLSHRESHRAAPIQMCDALAHNLPKAFQVILANCLSHARRKFVEIVEPFPREVELILHTVEQVYANDEIARNLKLSAQERLELHQRRSAFFMEGLRDWMQNQFATKTVEPNSVLGQAVSYTLKHWQPLTLFLRVPGAPLDNNICERILKRAILHRKNSMFYKTQAGAAVGDLFMSLISTCILNKTDPFQYLTETEKHAAPVAADPVAWLPWNYERTLRSLPAPVAQAS